VSSRGRPIFASADRLIFRGGRVGRPADDTGATADYGAGVRVRLDPAKVDSLLAAGLLAGAELQVWLDAGPLLHHVGAAVVAAVVTGSVAVRRRFPAAVGIGVQALLVLASTAGLTTSPTGPPVLAVAWFCALYALAAWTTPRGFAAGVVFFAASDLIPEAVSPDRKRGTVTMFTVVAVVVMMLVRRVLGDRDRRVRLAERERDLARREAVVEERARIARELHDAIAHNVSMIVVQAGAERRVLDADSDSTRQVLETIEQVGRGALTEMRRLVGMLRSDRGDPLAPQPGLGDLDLLVAQVSEAGLPVELAVEGERRELPVGIELSAYRIVQEALTNALKHAGNARATVKLRYGVDALELEIVDDGTGATPPVASGGHGLVGMRERVALYGGHLDAGRRSSGGFAVRVLLPIR
jgi:signal transduction histidine kinase